MRRSLVETHLPLLILGVLPCLISAPGITAQSNDGRNVEPESKIEEWIKDLASERFEQREVATRALMNLETEPLSLRKGLKSPDPEVRRRVAKILKSYVAKRAQRGLKKAQALAKERRVDEMVERLVCWREQNIGEDEWKAVAELAVSLVEWEHRTHGNTLFLSKDFARVVPSGLRRKNLSPEDTITPKELSEMWTRSRHYLNHEIVLDRRDGDLRNLVVLASGNLRITTIYGSILIANGSIRMQDTPRHSIIICDEDLDVSGGFHNCLAIVRGKVTCHEDSRITNSTVLSGGPITFSESVTVEGSAIFSRDSIACPKGSTLGKRALIRTHILDWPLKFFDPEVAGLTVWQVYRNDGRVSLTGGSPPLLALSDGIVFAGGADENPDIAAGVQIKKLRKASPFTDALHEREIITAIDNEKTLSQKIFRKLLRRKLAEGGPIISFTVRRTDDILEETWNGREWVLDGKAWMSEHAKKVERADKMLEVPINLKD